jgi:integrase/recombinase XerC
MQLRWEDIDLAGGFVQLKSEEGRRTKSGRSRSVPLTPRLRAALQEHAARFRLATYNGERSPFVFHHTTTRRAGVAGEQIRNIRKSFENAARAAKLPEGFRRHDLRHRRVTTWLAEGKSPALVQMAMGHASISTTMGYSNLIAEHLRPLVEEAPAAIRAVGGAR